VIYHEYAHAIVFNHSKDFYNLLGEFMPNHRLYQKDLKRIAII
jgi:predicted metal-dependent hydrolase